MIAKIVTNGSKQTVCLPDTFQLSDEEVYVQKIGEMVLLVPKDKAFVTLAGLPEIPPA